MWHVVLCFVCCARKKNFLNKSLLYFVKALKVLFVFLLLVFVCEWWKRLIHPGKERVKGNSLQMKIHRWHYKYIHYILHYFWFLCMVKMKWDFTVSYFVFVDAIYSISISNSEDEYEYDLNLKCLRNCISLTNTCGIEDDSKLCSRMSLLL